jgi:hypothetical protein
MDCGYVAKSQYLVKHWDNRLGLECKTGRVCWMGLELERWSDTRYHVSEIGERSAKVVARGNSEVGRCEIEVEVAVWWFGLVAKVEVVVIFQVPYLVIEVVGQAKLVEEDNIAATTLLTAAVGLKDVSMSTKAEIPAC